MQGLITVAFGRADPIPESLSVGAIMVGHHAVDIPTEVLLHLNGIRLHDDANRKKIIDFLERDLLGLHLVPDGIDRFRAALEFIRDAGFVQIFDDGLGELIDETGPTSLRPLQVVHDFLITVRLCVLQAQILHFCLDGVQPEPMGERSVHVHGL